LLILEQGEVTIYDLETGSDIMIFRKHVWSGINGTLIVVFGLIALGTFEDGRLLAIVPGEILEEASQTGPPVSEKLESTESNWGHGTRKMLEAAGVGREYFAGFQNDRPFMGDEIGRLLKVMYWVDRFAVLDVENWTKHNFSIEQLSEDPKAYQGEFFRLDGRAELIESVELSSGLVELFGWKKLFRCKVLLGKDKRPVVIFTRFVPKAWKVGARIDERVSVNGLFVKLGGFQEPIFVAQRIAWYPQTLLGNLGMDVGLLDDLGDRKKITKHERECFYQMLAAVGRARPGQLLQDAQRELKKKGQDSFSVSPLFNEPEKGRGRLVMLAGTARRVVRVRVDDPDIVARFGIDHYFEVFMFTPDSQGNPIVFCVRELPDGMPLGIDVGYGEFVEIAGFFMKKWSYQSIEFAMGKRYGDRKDLRRQLAPLLIARDLLWIPREQPISSSATTNLVAGLIFVLVLIGIWIAVWISGRRDKRMFDETLKEVRGEVDLTGLDVEVSGEYSFEDIDQIDTERKGDA